MSSQWVQHISGQGRRWLVVRESSMRWMVKPNDPEYMSDLDLPKEEYRLCEPPEQWVDVTSEVTLADAGRDLNHDFDAGRDLNHDRCQWRAVPMYNGESLYRLRKVELKNASTGAWQPAFLVERKQP